MREMKSHPWFVEKLPTELIKRGQDVYFINENPTSSLQSKKEIMNIVDEAKTLPESSCSDQLEYLTEALKKM